MNGVFQDLRYALRQMCGSPGFTALAVATLALGIGANTAIFSAVNALLLRPLPYHDANRLVRLWSTSDRFPTDVSSYPDFKDWGQQSRSLEQIAAYRGAAFSLSGVDRPQPISGLSVTAGFFDLFSLKPLLGRLFSADEESAGSNHIVLLGERLWRRQFGADPGVLGSNLKLSDENYTVVGILPAGFDFPPGSRTELVVPLPPDGNRDHGFLYVVGRLRRGTPLVRAQAEMSAIARRLAQQYKEDKGQGVYVQSLQASLANDYHLTLLVLQGAVAFVLLIACANVSNLLLGKSAGRRREFALRASLGAGKARLVQQLLCESLLLALMGGTVGWLLAAWAVKGLVALLAENLPLGLVNNIHLDGWVLAFVLPASLVTSLLAGMAPALCGSSVSLTDALKEGGRSLGPGAGQKRFGGAMVVFQVALALVLLSGAGLMLRSFSLLIRVDSGLHTDNVLALHFFLESARYANAAPRAAMFRQILERVGQIPGVRSEAMVADVPLTQNEDSLTLSIAGTPDPPAHKREARFNIVGPGYFHTLGIPLLAGRDFTASDNSSSPVVVVINQAMARAFWPDQNPIGQRISTDDKTWYSVSGIVGDVRQMGLRSEAKPEVYLSYLQDPYQWPFMSLLVHTQSDPLQRAGAVEQAVWSVDKDLPVSNPMTLEQIRSNSIAQPRVITQLLGLFAGLALVLASVGLYGVVARSVTERTHEIGVRMALGARTMAVFQLVLARGLALTLAGTALGLAGASLATRALASFLFSVRPTDPITFAAVSFLLMAVAFVASYLPARRATKVDPVVALRYE